MKYGWHATFMPKPLFGENGSGMHVHQSLSRDGKNAFFDADDQFYLSDTAKQFIAGQLRHARGRRAIQNADRRTVRIGRVRELDTGLRRL